MSLPESRVGCGWLEPAAYEENFSDLHPLLSSAQARAESLRCYYCYDAPCIQACPTGIDIPSFIARIGDGNVSGAAHRILSANILGGSCARVCPVESLCEGACVRNKDSDRPVQIGQLQRYATDTAFEESAAFFKRAESTGKSVAVVGAGPAGLACAHALALLGHEVTLHESKEKPGGLNEYGIAPYKLTADFAQREVEFILGVGGIRLLTGSKVGRDVSLENLRAQHDAVFVASGLPLSRSLGAELAPVEGVRDALSFIESLRQSTDLSAIPMGHEVVVIGGGSTAIDVAMECRRLGARKVVLAYRRGENDMSATAVEIALARTDGVEVITWARPAAWRKSGEKITGVAFERTRASAQGGSEDTGEQFVIAADMVFTATGQLQQEQALGTATAHLFTEPAPGKGARLSVDKTLHTSLAGVFGGGDCVNGGGLTVQAVQHGKEAAVHIHAFLSKGT